MASINQSPEVKSILKQTHDLTTALSNDPLGVAGKLLSKELICDKDYSKMLIDSYTPEKKAAILVRAVRNTIEIAPVKFRVFLEILSEQVCAKEVVEKLRSTYQSELSSLVHDQTCQSRWGRDYSGIQTVGGAGILLPHTCMHSKAPPFG
jgi:hypothetical protein